MAGPWQTLSTAIVARIDADTGPGGLKGTSPPGGLVTGRYNTQAPQGAKYPYIVIEQVSGPALKSFGSDGDEIEWQFGVYVGQFESGDSAIDAILERLKVLFDGVTLTLSGGWGSSKAQRTGSSNTVIADQVMFRADTYTVLLTR